MVKKCSVKNFRLVWIGAEVRLYASVAETFGSSATFYFGEKVKHLSEIMMYYNLGNFNRENGRRKKHG